jgi:hypothetical protein
MVQQRQAPFFLREYPTKEYEKDWPMRQAHTTIVAEAKAS